MFTQVRRFIKTGVIFLFAGLLTGFVMLVRRDLFGIYPDAHVTSAHVHAVAVGFVGFLILGVALWLFPRPPKEDTRYRPGRIEASYWLLTIATATRFAGELALGIIQSDLLVWLVIAASLGQIVGVAIYFWTMWPRIRPVGSQLREAAGERF